MCKLEKGKKVEEKLPDITPRTLGNVHKFLFVKKEDLSNHVTVNDAKKAAGIYRILNSM